MPRNKSLESRFSYIGTLHDFILNWSALFLPWRRSIMSANCILEPLWVNVCWKHGRLSLTTSRHICLLEPYISLQDFKASLLIHRLIELCRWSLTINANIKKFFYEKLFGSRLFRDGELVFSVVTVNFREGWSFRKGSETEMETPRSHYLNVEVTRTVSASLVT